MLEIKEVMHLDTAQKRFVMSIWNHEYPSTLAFSSISALDKYLSSLDQAVHFLLYYEQKIVGWCVEFQRDNEAWFAMIIDRNYQGLGIGKQVLRLLTSRNKLLFGWAVNEESEYKRLDGSAYVSPLPFYKKFGFSVISSDVLDTTALKAVRIMWQKKVPLIND